MESTTERKRALRSRLMAERARLSTEERATRSRAIAERAARLPLLAGASFVALYAPMGTEADVLELHRLLGPDRVVFPRTIPESRLLAFAHCSLRELVRGPLGAREPPPSAALVDRDSIECVVLPGIAFSADGYRLGRGGGYYDETLRELRRARRVGFAFDVQVLDTLPLEPHDQRLDAIVTESRTLTFARDPADTGTHLP